MNNQVFDIVKINEMHPVLLTDSRSLTDPTGTLFFALKTGHNDGHRYVRELYEKGVSSFVVQDSFAGTEQMPNAIFYKVEDTLLALQQLASYRRKKFDIPVIGITGSNGKTIVKEWLYQLLHDLFTIVRSPRSYNSQIGAPLSVWQLNKQTNLGIFEAGISLPDEMSRLEPIIRPTIGIFTTLGEAHQENFFSREEKCMEKLQLFEHSNTIIYNEDQVLVKYCIEQKGWINKSFSWSLKNKEANLFISKIDKNIDHTNIEYRTKGGKGEIEIPFTDEASIEDAIHCLALILHLSLQTEEVFKRFEKLDPVAMRLDVSKGIHNNTLINDTYNSDINSLAIALDFMSRRSAETKQKRVLILSDILQSGMVPVSFYRKVAELV
ncbi:bifunctional UDP-N-acetylmuramoyl-tripeptide:D-alanyl-D-alanine ligase/alanine racemase, partial [Bacteroidales bacterium OttesenSCG-928-I14]|nr:bifunctional UDP-N-acetylmuramoyl-tripeptide:D-alanyl-D-alanine ligase/alanine racemase [Bacteroidales bacterium OttesenSCG-928-I14]